MKFMCAFGFSPHLLVQSVGPSGRLHGITVFYLQIIILWVIGLIERSCIVGLCLQMIGLNSQCCSQSLHVSYILSPGFDLALGLGFWWCTRFCM